MKNKNMMIVGIAMIAFQFMVMIVIGLVSAYAAGSVIMIPKGQASLIICSVFLVLINLLSIGLICYGASENE